jgi:hypothetical protein
MERRIPDKRVLCGNGGRTWDEKVFTQYVKNQGRNPEDYEQIYVNKQ